MIDIHDRYTQHMKYFNEEHRAEAIAKAQRELEAETGVPMRVVSTRQSHERRDIGKDGKPNIVDVYEIFATFEVAPPAPKVPADATA